MTGRELLTKVLDEEGGPWEWLAILGALYEISEKPQEEDRPLLTKMANFEKRVELVHCYDGPHSRPADFFIRTCGRYGLARLNGEAYDYLQDYQDFVAEP